MARTPKKLAALAAAQTGDAVVDAMSKVEASLDATKPAEDDAAASSPDPNDATAATDNEADGSADAIIDQPATEAAPKHYRVVEAPGRYGAGDKIDIAINGRAHCYTVGDGCPVNPEHIEVLLAAGVNLKEF